MAESKSTFYVSSSFHNTVLHIPCISAKLILGVVDKELVSRVHTISSIIMLLVAIIHLYLNWKPLASYFKKLFK